MKFGFGRLNKLYMKIFITYLALAITTFIVNFAIFNYSFNSQATPFLEEEQRVDSALLMLKTTLPAYAISAIVITFIFYFVAKKMKK